LKPVQRRCYACGSTKHFLRDCSRRDEFRESDRNQQRSEASDKGYERRSESPHLKSILRRKSVDEGSFKTKHRKHFIDDEGDWNSDEN